MSHQSPVCLPHHNVNMTNMVFVKLTRSLRPFKGASSSWKDRGKGKGFGFVRSKIKKYICPSRNIIIVPGYNHSTSTSSSRLALPGQDNLESSRTNSLEGGAVSDIWIRRVKAIITRYFIIYDSFCYLIN